MRSIDVGFILILLLTNLCVCVCVCRLSGARQTLHPYRMLLKISIWQKRQAREGGTSNTDSDTLADQKLKKQITSTERKGQKEEKKTKKKK